MNAAQKAVAAAVVVGVLGGCQQVTYSDGRVGYSISPANLVGPTAAGPRSIP